MAFPKPTLDRGGGVLDGVDGNSPSSTSRTSLPEPEQSLCDLRDEVVEVGVLVTLTAGMGRRCPRRPWRQWRPFLTITVGIIAVLHLLLLGLGTRTVEGFGLTDGTRTRTNGAGRTALFLSSASVAPSLPLPLPPFSRPTYYYTQVVSDVDDTLKSSGGVTLGGVVALGGIDTQYARGTVYPGVAAFMLHLSLGTRGVGASGSNQQHRHPPPMVALLTARAEEFKGALQLKDTSPVVQDFAQTGIAAGYEGWGLGPVLYGSVAEWIVQDRKGRRKFTNFERLLQQDPTGELLRYVYVGDTGELDQEAGETMLREYPEVVLAVFLHVVSSSSSSDGGMSRPIPVPPPRLIQGRPIVFFRTYVGAATAAVRLDLMTIEGLRQVVEAACDALKDVPQTSDKWIDLRADLDLANQILDAYGG